MYSARSPCGPRELPRCCGGILGVGQSEMSRRIVAILAVLARRHRGRDRAKVSSAPADLDSIVARALLGRGNYIADVITSTRYCGKDIDTRATVIHGGLSEKIDMARHGRCRTAARLTHTSRKRERSSSAMPQIPCRRTNSSDCWPKITASVTCGQGQVAGREYSWSISNHVRDARPSKRLWIDKQTCVVLRSINYTSQGQPSTRMRVARIDYRRALDKS